VWSDIDSILSLWQDPRADIAYLERVWTNRPTRPANAWLPGGSWEPLKKRKTKDEPLVIGFDGSHTRDAAGLVAVSLSGRISVLREWERPMNAKGYWAVPRAEVDDALAQAMEAYEVREVAVNPDQWRTETEAWAALYGARVVIEFPINSPLRFSQACSRFYGAVVEKTLRHDGNPALQRHLYSALRRSHRDGEYIMSDGAPIALARAAVIAFERAAYHAARPTAVVAMAWR
jgi:phage terminase large subunit-like protein